MDRGIDQVNQQLANDLHIVLGKSFACRNGDKDAKERADCVTVGAGGGFFKLRWWCCCSG